MFLTLLMIFSPAAGWTRAADAARSLLRVIGLHLLPLLLLGCVAEAYGLTKWGRVAGPLGVRKQFTLEQVLPYEAWHFGIGLLVVLVTAVVLRGLGNTFHARQQFSAALAVSTFGLGPVFLLRLCDAFPALNPWLGWGIGAVLSAAILYQGVPRVLRLDPSHALGVYMSCALVAVLASGLGRLLVLAVIQPKLLGIHPTFL